MDATKIKTSDLMRRDVVRLDAGTPVDEATTLLAADRVSGAPVVDGGGRVVGVFSLTDVARAQGSGDTTTGSMRTEYYMPQEGIDGEPDEFAYKEDYSPETLASGTVAEWMSEHIVSVSPDDSARVACKRMSENGIHRLLVLEEGRLVGILSSSDVVRWIADNG